MKKNPLKVIILLAPGFEEVEALTPADYLRRAEIEVCTAAVYNSAGAAGNLAGIPRLVTGSHDISVIADTALHELADQGRLEPSFWDAVIVPGGMPGSTNLAASEQTGEFLKSMAREKKWIFSICAAPAVVLAPLGLLEGRNFTCYPGHEEKVKGANWREDRVVPDNSPGCFGLITSRGAGTAGEFSAAIIAALLSEDAARQISEKVLLGV